MTRQIAALIRRYPFIIHLPYLISRRAQARYTAGVVAVIIDSRGRALIVEHVFHPHHPWGLPGGWLGHDEAPAAAIARELREELQLTVKVIETLHIAKSSRSHIDIAFLCQAQSSIGKLSKELLDYQWAGPHQLPDMHPFHRRAIDIAFEGLRRSPKWAQV